MDEQETSIEIGEIFEAIKKRKQIIIWVTLLSVILTAIVTIFLVKPTYEAHESVIISKQADSSSTAYNYNDVMMYQNMLKTYAAIAQNESVAQQTIDDLKLNIKAPVLMSQVKVVPQTSTQIIDLKFQSKDPEEAYNVAEKYTDNFIKRANELLPSGSITVLDKADFPKSPVKPRVKIDIAIAFVLGIMASIGIIFLLEYSDNTIKTEKDIEKYLGVPVVGVIPENISRR